MALIDLHLEDCMAWFNGLQDEANQSTDRGFGKNHTWLLSPIDFASRIIAWRISSA
jgi:hypothetical protein